MKTIVVVPTYNEASNITVLIEEIIKQDKDIHVLIIDDDSPDGTGKIADTVANNNDRINVIHRASRMGLGTAYLIGFKYALKNNYDYVITLDADFSHDPSDISRLRVKIKDNDLCIGSRYSGGIRVINWPLRRLFLSVGANLYLRLITGLKVEDCTSGYRCYSIDALKRIDLDSLRSSGYAFLAEILYKMHRRKLKIEEIPIIFTERKIGISKMKKSDILESMIIPFVLRIKSLLGSDK
jgi:dolichol-phosphate mannosyltransferase